MAKVVGSSYLGEVFYENFIINCGVYHSLVFLNRVLNSLNKPDSMALGDYMQCFCGEPMSDTYIMVDSKQINTP